MNQKKMGNSDRCLSFLYRLSVPTKPFPTSEHYDPQLHRYNVAIFKYVQLSHTFTVVDTAGFDHFSLIKSSSHPIHILNFPQMSIKLTSDSHTILAVK